MVRIVGIDPGVNGAVALFTDEVRINQAVVVEIPTTETDAKHKFREIRYRQLGEIVWGFRPDHVFIEIVNARPGRDEKTGEEIKFGGTSLFRFGGAFFAIKAIVDCLGLDFTMVASPSWKNHFGLEGGKASKEAGRLLVIDRFPDLAEHLKFKYTHNLAEAYLIAAYGAYKRGHKDPRLTPAPPRLKKPRAARKVAQVIPFEEDEEIPL